MNKIINWLFAILLLLMTWGVYDYPDYEMNVLDTVTVDTVRSE